MEKKEKKGHFSPCQFDGKQIKRILNILVGASSTKR
jgi:hypothetical protein